MRQTWELPAVINPTESICVQIQVPKDDAYIQAFWGCLEELCKAWNWDYDGNKTGSLVAYVWQSRIDSASQLVRIGENCIMPLDCNEVEACLATSTIIQNIINDVQNNENSINTINTNVTNLDNRLTTVEGDITTIQGDVTNLDNRLTIVEGDFDSFITVDLPAINLLLSNHENRISILENLMSLEGLGLSLRKESLVWIADPAIGAQPNSFTSLVPSELAMDFKGGGLTVVSYSFMARQGGSQGSQETFYRIILDGQVGEEHVLEAKSTSDYDYITVEAVFRDVTTGTHSAYLQWISTGNTTYIHGNVVGNVWEIAPIPESNSNVVTFDLSGLPYTLTPTNLGTIEPSGNTGNCLATSSFLSDNEYIEVEFSLDVGSPQQINDVLIDFLTDNFYTHMLVFVDNVQMSDSPIATQSLNDSQWHTRSWATLNPSYFPVTGSVVRVRFTKYSGALSDLRLDNLTIVT